MKRILEKKYYILAFIIPMLICVIFLFFKEVIPNIELFFASDLRGQHLPILNYLKGVMLGKNSLYYSYYAGMGSSMMSTIIFYAISPLNILLVIIKDVQCAILSIYIMKLCLSGLCMFIFLKNKFKKEGFVTVVFSMCYAVSAYVVNYFFCIFWLDSVYLAPLVLLGIDKIMDKEKINLIYIFSLSLAIICNIQMGFGLCIFSVIYYLYSFNIKYSIKKDFKKFIQLSKIFLISSLCVGAISSGFILAFLSDYKDIKVARSIDERSFSGTSSVDYIIRDLFAIGKKKTNYHNRYEPLIYCGLIITLLSILYLFDKDISKKKRKSALIVILVFIISFCFRNINVFWHLTETIDLNYRYSIYLSLFLMMISYDYYISKDRFVRRDIIILIISMLVGLLFDLIYQKELYLIHTVVFLLLSGVLIILVKNISKRFEVLFFLVIFVELTFNAYLSFYNAKDLPFSRISSYNSVKKLDSFNKFSQDYRVLYNYSYTGFLNDSLLLNSNSSPRYFSSVINGNLMKFLNRNNSPTGNNYYLVSAYDSPLLVSLLGGKYFYLLDDVDSGLYKKVDTYKIRSYDYTEKKVVNRKVYLYENPYSLSLGYVIDKDVKYNMNNLVDYQNEIIKNFTGNNKDVIKRVEFGEIENSSFCEKEINYICKFYYIKNITGNEYNYFYAPTHMFYVDSKTSVYNDRYPILIKNAKDYFEFHVYFVEEYDMKNMLVATYDKDNLISSLKMLQENMLTDVKVDKNVMKAKIESSKDGILFLAIPYDKRFKIYVDGKRVKYYPMLDNAFIGLDIKEGNHKIKLVNKNDNLKWYILLSIVSVIVTIVLYLYQYKWRISYDENC